MEGIVLVLRLVGVTGPSLSATVESRQPREVVHTRRRKLTVSHLALSSLALSFPLQHRLSLLSLWRQERMSID